jgi:ribosomal protein RSM22 (predicted rRNA methylase)
MSTYTKNMKMTLSTIPRGKYHRRAKEASLPYENEKYSYLVVSKTKELPHGDRIIKAPIVKSGHVILDLCTREAKVERRIVSKSEGDLYSQARDSAWGDVWNEDAMDTRKKLKKDI